MTPKPWRLGPLALRWSEWLSLLFFLYIAALVPWFRDRPFLHLQPLAVLAIVLGIYASLVAGERHIAKTPFSMTRDWIPMAVTLLAFQEMDLFRPLQFANRLEAGWIIWDVRLLRDWGLAHAIEGLGSIIPWLLESSYFLVYGTAAFGVWVLYVTGRRRLVDRFYFLYFAGTLGAYALFPFLPSEPPRFLYPDVAPPGVTTWMRSLNLYLLRAGTIHMSVFPSAHVSSAFSAAWAIFLLLPGRKLFGWVFLLYAICVAIATIYGRYHYAADAVAGIAVSVAARAVYRIFAAILDRGDSAESMRVPN